MTIDAGAPECGEPSTGSPGDSSRDTASNSPRMVPAAEVDIDVDVVRGLLAEQHPDLADRPLRLLTNGWDNVMYRLGPDLTVRLPRRELAARLVEHEQRWLPELAPALPLPVPAPVRIGRPTTTYPWSWSILRWFDGGPAGADPDLDQPAAAEQLGRFLAALHRPAPVDAPDNPFRGGPLSTRADGLERWLGMLGGVIDRAALSARWQHCAAAPTWAGPPLWIHGDLHAHNLLSHEGRLVAVIDFGDLTSGDPATDLSVAWSLLDPEDRSALRRAADTDERPIDDALWLRAEGWALSIGAAVLANSADHPAMAAMGRRMLAPFLLDGDQPVDGNHRPRPQ